MPYGNVTVSRIISVSDGDTFVCDIDHWPTIIGLHVPIRIDHIDALELDDTRPAAQALALKAQRFLEYTLATAKDIALCQMRRGKYFRIIANVLVDGRGLSQLIIQEGLALPYEGGKKPTWLNLP